MTNNAKKFDLSIRNYFALENVLTGSNATIVAVVQHTGLSPAHALLIGSLTDPISQLANNLENRPGFKGFRISHSTIFENPPSSDDLGDVVDTRIIDLSQYLDTTSALHLEIFFKGKMSKAKYIKLFGDLYSSLVDHVASLSSGVSKNGRVIYQT